MPGLIEWPGKIRPGNTAMPAVTSDYLPTILDFIGAKPVGKRPLDGISLRPLFLGEMKDRGQSIGFQSAGQVALIGDRFKLWGRAGGKQVDELPLLKLFDLVNDPSEKTDIAAPVSYTHLTLPTKA